MTITLMPEQVEDGKRIADGDRLIFSEAGTGKTLTALEGMRQLGCLRGVVVCPPNATMMWEEWLGKYLGVTVQRIKSGNDEIDPDACWYVLSVYLSYRPIANKIARVLFKVPPTIKTGGIFDEGHYAKNHLSRTKKAVYGAEGGGGAGGIFSALDHPIVLTGTPILRHSDDLYPHLSFHYPQELEAIGIDNIERFREMFCHQQLRQFHPRQRPTMTVIGSKNNKVLNGLLYKNCGAVRRLFKSMQVSLPPLTERTIHTPIGKMTKKLSATANLDMASILKALSSDDPIMAEAWQDLGVAKTAAMIEYITDQARDHAVLVGVWHTSVGNIIESAVDELGFTHARVRGGMTAKAKELIRQDFNDGKYQVLIGQVRSMNEAWNLQAHGWHIIMAEDHWSPGLVEQFYKRVYRLGQQHNCQLDFLKADHPIDKAITNSRTGKLAAQMEVLGD